MALVAVLARRYVSFINWYYFVSIWRRVLPVIFLEEGISLCSLADSPPRWSCSIKAGNIVGARARRTAVSFIEPRLCMRSNLLFVVVPKNFGPTE